VDYKFVTIEGEVRKAWWHGFWVGTIFMALSFVLILILAFV